MVLVSYASTATLPPILKRHTAKFSVFYGIWGDIQREGRLCCCVCLFITRNTHMTWNPSHSLPFPHPLPVRFIVVLKSSTFTTLAVVVASSATVQDQLHRKLIPGMKSKLPSTYLHYGTVTPGILSLHFNAHFPGEPGLAGVYGSKGWWRWWWQLDYRSYKSCKAPVKSSPPTNQHPVFYKLDALPVAQPTVSTHWREKDHIGLAYPKLNWGLPTLSLMTNSSWLPWGRVAMPLISPLMPVITPVIH